jgi:hypothetical protein
MEKELFDSYEEFYFDCYLQELVQEGYVIWYKYHPDALVLSERVDYLEKKLIKRGGKKNQSETTAINPKLLLYGHTYQCDFLVQWAKKAEGVFFNRINSFIEEKKYFMAQEFQGKTVSLIDIKGGFSNSRLSSDVQFPINQKWVMSKYGLYIQKVSLVVTKKKGTRKVYSGLFPDTFTPARYLKTDGGHKSRTIHFEYILLPNFINKIKFQHYDYKS